MRFQCSPPGRSRGATGWSGVPGRIVNFVNFLTTKRVLYPRICGVDVPQGGVLSPLLFNLHLGGINEILPVDVRTSMYADDLLLYTRQADPHLALLRLEEAVGLLTPSLRDLGLSISIPKCQLCLFTRARSGLRDLVMRVDGCEIRCQDSLKYLGVVLDARLTWTPHIKYIAGKAMRAIGVLKALSRVSWGVSPSLLLTVYRGLVRAYLEWGSPLFAGPSGTPLRFLDRAQYEALRVVLGCVRSTPIAVLLSEASEPPLGLRRSLLGGRFILRNASRKGGYLIPKLSFCICLVGFTSVLSAELYSIFCALKFILRMALPLAVVFSDSLYALYHLRDGPFSSRVSPYVFKILHLLSLIRERGCAVGFVWIPAHSGIGGNEQTDVRSVSGSNDYFNRVTFKTPRPWFAGSRFPRGYISLVTRLRSSHICTSSHFIRMGWDLEVGCSCGAELGSLANLIGECPILSEGRPRFFRFLAERFPGRPPEQTDLGDLIFEPDPEDVGVGEIYPLWRPDYLGSVNLCLCLLCICLVD